MPPRTKWSKVALLVAALALASCSGTSGPSQPAPSASPFVSGTYQLMFLGADAVSVQGSFVPACPGIGTVGGGQVVTEVEMTADGNTWLGRPRTPSGGSFVLTLTPGPLGPGGPSDTFGVAGTVSGEALNPAGGSLPTRVTFGGDSRATASLSGSMSTGASVAGGFVSGDVVFSNSTGRAVSCSSDTVRWFMSRKVP